MGAWEVMELWVFFGGVENEIKLMAAQLFIKSPLYSLIQKYNGRLKMSLKMLEKKEDIHEPLQSFFGLFFWRERGCASRVENIPPPP